jgi:hypothetical protein
VAHVPDDARVASSKPRANAGKQALDGAGGVRGMYLLVTCISDYTARRMDVYTMSLRTAAESKVFADQIGEPYSVEWPISLSAEATDTDGNAAFRAKVKGPAGKGALVAAGKKENRVWRLTQLGLIPSSTRQYVSLLPMQTVQTSAR